MTFAHPQAKRRSKSMILGKVINAAGPNKYNIRFINGLETEVESCKLKVLSDEDVERLRRSNDENDDESCLSDHDSSNVSNVTASSDDEEPVDMNENSQSSVETNGSTVENSNDEEQEEMPSISYHEKLMAARDKIKHLTGETVEQRYRNDTILWRVIEEHVCQTQERSYANVGLKPDVLSDILNGYQTFRVN